MIFTGVGKEVWSSTYFTGVGVHCMDRGFIIYSFLLISMNHFEAVVLVLKRLWGGGFKSHQTDWESLGSNLGPLGTR